MACRKNYRDLTPTEKQRLVAALHHVKANGTVDQFANEHDAFFHQAHHSSHFLPWHREFLRRFEVALQASHPSVTIPYWNSTVDTSPSDPLWATDFLGPLDATWGLGRALGSASMSAPGAVDALLNLGSYDVFWPGAEGPVHNNPHNWVEGVMSTGASPGDPVFYLHHCFIDAIWAQWQLRHPEAAYVSSGAGRGLGDPMAPWATTPADVLDHRRICTYLYLPGWTADTPRALLVTPQVEFLDVPEGEVRMAAAVVDVDSCERVDFVVEDPSPAPPFAKQAGVVPVTPSLDSRGRMWLTYRGTTATEMHNGMVRVHCAAANFDETVALVGNTIARPTAAVALVLDQSNSMTFDSGIGSGITRADVLRFSAPPIVTVSEDVHAICVSSFDHDAHPGIGLTDVGEGGRVAISGAISNYAPNPNGWTSIGEGIFFAHSLLQPATQTVRAMIVLTDGQENHGPHSRRSIDDVWSTVVGDHMFAIGLGQGDALNPQKLERLCKDRRGYMVLTGNLDEGGFFRLAKYYQQIFAGVTNNEVVLDPDGWIGPSQEQRIPFWLSEADISAKAVLLTPMPWMIEVELETPAGEVVDMATAAAHPMVTWDMGSGASLYRIGLPLPLSGPTDAHTGQWHAVLRIRHDAVSIRSEATHVGQLTSVPAGAVSAAGLRYNFNVHTYSNLRMRATVAQTSYVPGATVTLRTVLTEYGAPVLPGGACVAEVTAPDGSTGLVGFVEGAAGEFEASFVAALDGVYTMRILGSGWTRRGRPFTREQTRTAAVWLGGDREPPDPNRGSGDGREDLCDLVTCLLKNRGVRRLLERNEIDLDELRSCVEHWCRSGVRGGEGGDVGRGTVAKPFTVETVRRLLNDATLERIARMLRES